MKHVNILVFGEVQGVGFRYEAVLRARALNLKGLVRNEPDGSVYIEAEGGENDLEKFIEWCRKGLRGAVVDKVEVESGQNLKNFSEFSIEY